VIANYKKYMGIFANGYSLSIKLLEGELSPHIKNILWKKISLCGGSAKRTVIRRYFSKSFFHNILYIPICQYLPDNDI